jgi:ribosomal protein L28
MNDAKKCNVCCKEKSLSDFFIKSRTVKGKTYSYYNRACKECVNAITRNKRREIKKSLIILDNKICPQCGETKSAIEFNQDLKSSDGLFAFCKICSSLNRTKLYASIREATIKTGNKKCCQCKRVKSISDFNVDNNKPDGLLCACKACLKIKRAAKVALLIKNAVIPDHKICYRCKEDKPSSDFKPNTYRKDGLHYLCRSCDKLRNDARIVRNLAKLVVPEKKVCFTCKIEKPAKEFWEDSRSVDGLSYNCASCGAKRAEEYNKSLGEEFIIKSRERAKKWYKKNIEHVKQYQREYNKENHAYVSARQLRVEKERYHTDPNFNITLKLRKRLRGALYAQFVLKKGKRTLDFLGCSLDQFKFYFEAKFTEGMSWDNFLAGKIHIDHIIPCASFDLIKPEEQAKCFHYTNLQPLWCEDNIRKGARLDWVKEDMGLRVVANA